MVDPQAYLAKACSLLRTELDNGGLPLKAFLAKGVGKEAGECVFNLLLIGV